MLPIAELIEQGFTVKQRDELVLVTGSPLVQWNTSNLIYRSSMWTVEGEPVSLSFCKFFNWNEADNIVPKPVSFEQCNFYEKLDGSLLIFSKYKGKLIIRTRGTFNLGNFLTSDEVEWLKCTYPMVVNNAMLATHEISILCEWVSPQNRIVLDYGNAPKLFLVGIVYHSDYSYAPQKELDKIAKVIHVQRPQRLTWVTFAEMVQQVELGENYEGVCCYYDNDQHIKKVKTLWYLALHALKNNVTLENMVDLFIKSQCTTYESFYQYICSQLDFEIAEMVKGLMEQICTAEHSYCIQSGSVKTLVEGINSLPRKEAALQIQNYLRPEWWAIAFTLLDGKPINGKQHKKMLLHLLEVKNML